MLRGVTTHKLILSILSAVLELLNTDGPTEIYG
jgi:hypothetical protein